MSDFRERISHYETKCRQHLSRVRLSHVLALEAVKLDSAISDERYDVLIHSSFGFPKQDLFGPKMCAVLHGLHLVSLKANFELFLNRLLTTIWTFHFTKLAPSLSGDISLRELSELFEDPSESTANVREFIVDKIVPRYGLSRFDNALTRATNIHFPDVLNRKDFRYWPQIFTAFEVRHLVEHRDGHVDREFRMKLDRFWVHSSWGPRHSLERLKKVLVEEEDVIATYDAMLEAAGLLSEEVLQWNSERVRVGLP